MKGLESGDIFVLIVVVVIFIAFFIYIEGRRRKVYSKLLNDIDENPYERFMTADEAMPTQSGLYRAQQVLQKPTPKKAAQEDSGDEEKDAGELPDPFGPRKRG